MKTARRKPKKTQKLRKPKRLRRIKVDPKLPGQLIPSTPKPKVDPEFRSRHLAWRASHDLRRHAGQIYHAALARNELFFKYLAEFLQKKPIRLPVSEDQMKLIALLFYQIPKLSDSEIREKLGWSKGYYRAQKKRALERFGDCSQAWRAGWAMELTELIALDKKMLTDFNRAGQP